MADRLLSLRWLLQDPAGNTAAAGLGVAIIVLGVILVALVLIASAMPSRRMVRKERTERGLDEVTDDDALQDLAPKTRTPGWVVTLAFIGIVMTGAIAGTAVWYKATSTEEYCTSMCHAMAEPSDAWATSAHAGVSCVRCHEGRPWVSFRQGVRLRSYSLYLQLSGARARRVRVPDARCFECHRNLLDTKMVARNNEQFTHREVLAEQPDCVACHGQQGHEPPRPKPARSTSEK